MDKDKLLMVLAHFMTTLAETDNALPVPRSTLYLAMGMDLEGSDHVLSVGESMGWLRTSSQTVRLTDKGRKQAEKFSKVLAK